MPKKQDERFLEEVVEKIEYMVSCGVTGIKAHRDAIKEHCEKYLGKFVGEFVQDIFSRGVHQLVRRELVDSGRYEIGARNELKLKQDLTDEDSDAIQARRFYQMRGRGHSWRDWYPEHDKPEPAAMQQLHDALDCIGTEIGLDSAAGLYDYDALLNGEIWEVEAGRDFDCLPRSFREQVRREARRRGLKLQSEVHGEGNLVIQAYKPSSLSDFLLKDS